MLKRPPTGQGSGGSKPILRGYETQAVHSFIRELLQCSIQPTYHIVIQWHLQPQEGARPRVHTTKQTLASEMVQEQWSA